MMVSVTVNRASFVKSVAFTVKDAIRKNWSLSYSYSKQIGA